MTLSTEQKVLVAPILIAVGLALVLGFGVGWYVFHPVESKTMVPDYHELAKARGDSLRIANSQAQIWQTLYEDKVIWATMESTDAAIKIAELLASVRKTHPDNPCDEIARLYSARLSAKNAKIDSLLRYLLPAYYERWVTLGDEDGEQVTLLARTGFSVTEREFAQDWVNIQFKTHKQNVNLSLDWFDGFYIGTTTRFGLRKEAPAQVSLQTGWEIHTPKFDISPEVGIDSYLRGFAGASVRYFPARRNP